MGKQIVMLAVDPGGAKAIIPLAKELLKKHYRIRLYGKGRALAEYERAGLVGLDLATVIKNIGPEQVESFLRAIGPDFIITGTSANDMTEKYVWQAATKLGVGSFAIIDHWINYGIRFSEYGIEQQSQYDRDRQQAYLPTKILVMDEYARQEMIKEGFSPAQVLVTGQPHFDEVRAGAGRIKAEELGQHRRALGIEPDDYVVTFAPDAITTAYRETDDAEHYLGYTEKTILKELLTALVALSTKQQRKIVLVIRPHPKDKVDKFSAIVADFKSNYLMVKYGRLDPIAQILMSDLVCGMYSMFLIESAILGKQILSIQIGLKTADPFVLSRQKIVASILDRGTLAKRLQAKIIENENEHYDIKVGSGAAQNIINSMENILCQN